MGRNGPKISTKMHLIKSQEFVIVIQDHHDHNSGQTLWILTPIPLDHNSTTLELPTQPSSTKRCEGFGIWTMNENEKCCLLQQARD